MLPPDTSLNFLPWRVLVPLMQVYGCFPYRMSSTSAPPVFSLPLCLWSVVMQLLVFIMFCFCFYRHYMSYLTSDMGTVAYICSCLLMIVSLLLAPIILAVKSNVVATFIHELPQIISVSRSPTHRWYCEVKTLVGYFLLFVCFPCFAMGFVFTVISNSPTILEFLFYTPAAFLCQLNFWMPLELAYGMFSLLSHRLLVATEDKVAMVSSLLTSDGSFKCESDMKAAMVALRDLDAVIREVERQREKGTNHFFLIFTILLMSAILLAISCPYAIMKGSFMGGTTLAALLLAYYMMGRLCHVGQVFSNQVREAERTLKELRGKSQNLIVSVKVSHVMGSLSSLLTFDMCGWYTLSYSSFLGLINTILTYLVIIFQVGGVAVESSISSLGHRKEN